MSKLLQAIGLLIFGLTLWKGVHGFWVTTGLIFGAGLAYAAKHYDLSAAVAELKALRSRFVFPHLLIFLALCLLTGCAEKKMHARVVIPRPCLESVELTDRTECRGEDTGKLSCGPLVLKKRCETLSAKK